MKTLRTIVLVSAVLLAACVKETLVNTSGSSLTFSGKTEPCLDSKAALEASGSAKVIRWKAGDLLLIHDGAHEAIFKATDSGTESSFIKDSGEDLPENGDVTYTAWYPSEYWSEGNFYLPKIQTYHHKGIGIFPMTARSQDTRLSFRSVCSALEIRLSATEEYAGKVVRQLILESSGEALSGKVEYDYFTDEVTVSGCDSLVIDIPDGIEIGTLPVSVFAAVPPGTYAPGLAVTVICSDTSSETLTAGKAMTLRRSYAYNTGIRCSEIVWDYSYGEYNCVNAYGKTSVEIDITSYCVGTDCLKGRKATKAIRASAAVIISNTDGGIIDGTPVLEGETLKISLKEGVYGNAVAGITDSEGNILWSYHIWKPSEDPSAAIRYTSTGLDIMPMPLGALKACKGSYDQDMLGLYYQWGRKDPFARFGTVKRILENDTFAMLEGKGFMQSSTAVEYATSHPDTFISNACAPSYDWASTELQWRNDNLWGDPKGYITPSGVKSVYDPCPEGWKVAPKNAWSGFTFDSANHIKDSDGTTFKGYGFEVAQGVWDYFLIQGYRSRANGGISAGTTQGYVWMSSPNTADNHSAAGMNFDKDKGAATGSRLRSYGFPVRCCKI